MAAYFITDYVILDNGQFQQYRAQLRKTVETIGGRYLAEGRVETLDGRPLPAPAENIIVAEFPSIERAREWHRTGYAALAALRMRAINSTFVVLVPGL